ncbi:MAG: DUF177 domain-containing protein [Myxococcota bacterium]|nr:DUF177 domain-containing protein [Myxococcota bacterium]
MDHAPALGLQLIFEDLKLAGRSFQGTLDASTLNDQIKGFAGEFGYQLLGEAEAAGTVYRTDSGEVIVTGELSLSLQYKCVACLKSRVLPLKLRGDYIMSQAPKVKSFQGEEETLEIEDEPEIYPFTGNEIDLEPLFREEILLTLTQHPRCDLTGPACPPISYGEERSAEGEIDPRWAHLLKIQAKLKAAEKAEGE